MHDCNQTTFLHACEAVIMHGYEVMSLHVCKVQTMLQTCALVLMNHFGSMSIVDIFLRSRCSCYILFLSCFVIIFYHFVLLSGKTLTSCSLLCQRIGNNVLSHILNEIGAIDWHITFVRPPPRMHMNMNRCKSICFFFSYFPSERASEQCRSLSLHPMCGAYNLASPYILFTGIPNFNHCRGIGLYAWESLSH